MNLRNLSDEVLLSETEHAAAREREALSVLHHIREVDRRRLYAKLKYQSLADYMIKHLKYTEDQAWPRISAMKPLKEIPEIEAKINDGALSLSNLNLARRVFLQEEKRAKESHLQRPSRTVEEKIAVLEKLEHVSKREAEKIVRAETGIVLKSRESVRELSDGQVEMTVLISKEDLAMVERLKGLLAHSHAGLTNGELVRLALKALGEKSDPLKKATRATARPVPERSATDSSSQAVPKKSAAAKGASLVSGVQSRYIPATVRHHVWLRDGGVCTNCGSSRAVQHEHIIPLGLGGPNTIDNIKLLCRSCNQRSAMEVYGASRMAKYLKAPRLGYGTPSVH